jgi:hypothetical protein
MHVTHRTYEENKRKKSIIKYETTEEAECDCQVKDGEIVRGCNGLLSRLGDEEI